MKELDFPFIEHKRSDGQIGRYWQAGCRQCGEGESFSIFTDGKDGLLIRCKCGSVKEWGKFKFQDQPDFVWVG